MAIKQAADLVEGDVLKAPALYEQPFFVFKGHWAYAVKEDQHPQVGNAPRHLYAFLFEFPNGQCTVMHVPKDYLFEEYEA